MTVPAVWRLVCSLAAYPSELRSRLQHTGETRCAPLLKIQKQAAFVIIHLLKNKTSYEKSMNLIVPRIAFRIFR